MTERICGHIVICGDTTRYDSSQLKLGIRQFLRYHFEGNFETRDDARKRPSLGARLTRYFPFIQSQRNTFPAIHAYSLPIPPEIWASELEQSNIRGLIIKPSLALSVRGRKLQGEQGYDWQRLVDVLDISEKLDLWFYDGHYRVCPGSDGLYLLFERDKQLLMPAKFKRELKPDLVTIPA